MFVKDEEEGVGFALVWCVLEIQETFETTWRVSNLCPFKYRRTVKVAQHPDQGSLQVT